MNKTELSFILDRLNRELETESNAGCNDELVPLNKDNKVFIQNVFDHEGRGEKVKDNIVKAGDRIGLEKPKEHPQVLLFDISITSYLIHLIKKEIEEIENKKE